MGLFSRRKDGAEPDAGLRRKPGKLAARGEGRGNTRGNGHDSGEALDPAETQKRRARRRLIGATVLVLGVIVFLPMVFDPGPKPLADDIVVQIPDKESAFNPAVPAKAPDKPADKASDAKAAAVPAPVIDPVAPAKTADAAKAVKAPEKVAEKVAEKAAENAPEKTVPVKGEEAARAQALLDGKAPAGTDAAKTDGWAVQLGAFANADKVKDLRAKLTTAGLKSYTETVKTPQGDRIRVRVGPFPTRDAAEKARDRVKKHLVIDGVVVSA